MKRCARDGCDKFVKLAKHSYCSCACRSKARFQALRQEKASRPPVCQWPGCLEPCGYHGDKGWRPRKYCQAHLSLSRATAARMRVRPGKPPCVCKVCAKSFRPCAGARGLYCSKACFYESQRMPSPEVCRHCHKVKPTRPRGLCWACYYTPGVRDLYPADPRSVSKVPSPDEIRRRCEEVRRGN